MIWGLLRALLPATADGLVQVLACDPKLMELAFGRSLFRYGRYEPTPNAIVRSCSKAPSPDMQSPRRASSPVAA